MLYNNRLRRYVIRSDSDKSARIQPRLYGENTEQPQISGSLSADGRTIPSMATPPSPDPSHEDLEAAEMAEDRADLERALAEDDGEHISLAEYRNMSKEPRRYLSLAQVERHLGLGRGALSRAKMPEPDSVIGRGTVRGWLPETIDAWDRPGQGKRTDLQG